jgi:outer membrane lipoprotein-sorting protein
METVNRNLRMSVTAVVALALGSAWCFGATVEEIEKQIKSAHEKLKTCSAKVVSNTEMKQGGQEISMNMVGTYELMQKGGKTMYRMESKTTMKMSGMPNIPGGGEQDVLIVCDGDTVYTQTSRMGMTQAVKTKPEENMIERPWGKLAESTNSK